MEFRLVVCRSKSETISTTTNKAQKSAASIYIGNNHSSRRSECLLVISADRRCPVMAVFEEKHAIGFDYHTASNGAAASGISTNHSHRVGIDSLAPNAIDQPIIESHIHRKLA